VDGGIVEKTFEDLLCTFVYLKTNPYSAQIPHTPVCYKYIKVHIRVSEEFPLREAQPVKIS
jgi:hypothetical protein